MSKSNILKFAIWIAKSPYVIRYNKFKNGQEFLIFEDYSTVKNKCTDGNTFLGYHSNPLTSPLRKGFEDVYNEFLKDIRNNKI
jgi:hypothetical protein